MKMSRYGFRSKQRGFLASIPLIAAGIGAAASMDASRKASNSADKATDAANRQADLAEEQWNLYKDNYLPVEQRLIKDANEYDSPEARDNAANSAMADQRREYDAASRTLGNRFASMGLDPSQGRYQSGLRDMAVQGAAAQAGAGTLARRAVEAEGFQRRATVAGIGRGIPGQVENGLAAAQKGLANAANANADNAGRTAQGVTYLANKGLNAFSKWYGQPGAEPQMPGASNDFSDWSFP